MSGQRSIPAVWFLALAILACGPIHVRAAEPVLLRANLAKPGPYWWVSV
jgi:hypothetical protein